MKGILVFFLAFFYSLSLLSQTIDKEREQASIKKIYQRRDSIIQSNLGRAYSSFNAKSVSDGRIITEDDLKGKVSLINLWFRGCGPCVEEFGELNALNAKFRGDSLFQIVSFTFDEPDDVKETIKEYSLTYLICSITRDECYQLNFGLGFPTNIIVDKDGNIAHFCSRDFVALESKIREMLANCKPTTSEK